MVCCNQCQTSIPFTTILLKTITTYTKFLDIKLVCYLNDPNFVQTCINYRDETYEFMILMQEFTNLPFLQKSLLSGYLYQTYYLLHSLINLQQWLHLANTI